MNFPKMQHAGNFQIVVYDVNFQWRGDAKEMAEVLSWKNRIF